MLSRICEIQLQNEIAIDQIDFEFPRVRINEEAEFKFEFTVFKDMMKSVLKVKKQAINVSIELRLLDTNELVNDVCARTIRQCSNLPPVSMYRHINSRQHNDNNNNIPPVGPVQPVHVPQPDNNIQPVVNVPQRRRREMRRRQIADENENDEGFDELDLEGEEEG